MKFSVLVCTLVLVACVESRNHGANKAVEPKDAASCQDGDGDGYGEGCESGGDCNDADDTVHANCQQCVTPQQGCGCPESSKPVSCFLSPTAANDGTVMCHEGTRYCRGGEWSACESVVSYPKPESVQPQAVIAADAGASRCNDCNINCFVVRDNLDPLDAGIDATSNHTQLTDAGGLTLTYTLSDAGATADAGTFDPSTCVLGTAPDHDCDGIPDTYDPYPNMKPFATANPTIFLDIAPGETGTGVINLQFYLNSADVYFLVDQTGSMAGERDRLVADLVSGDFINNASYNCADYDFDFQPNNELKAQGIVGAIRCIIRDANFGVGYFRELPFQNSTSWPSFYGYTDSITYRHIQDITSNLNLLTTGVNKLTTVGNIDWAEASMIALNSVVTGNGIYVGTTRPGLPTRGGCPSLAWGYPCFRSNAIPIVLMFTDAPFHNGPAATTGPAILNDPYNTAYTGITKGTDASYVSVTPTNENYTAAYDLGDLTNKVYSYIGSTEAMTSDLPHSASSCSLSGSQDSPDALFKFSLTSTKTVNLTTAGSDFDTTVALYRGTSSAYTSTVTNLTSNDNGSNAYAFGAAASKYIKATGSNSSLISDYSANDVSCSASPGAKDATFTFTLAASTKVALDTAGSSYGTVLGLFSGTPTATTYTAVSNTNDNVSAPYAAGALNTKNLGFSGDTSASGITANYTASQLGCTNAPADAAPDAVYSFTLSSATRVRVSAEDSALNSVLVLTDNNTQYPTPVAQSTNTNDLLSSATDLGAMDGKAYIVTGGDSSGLAADYSSALVGCSASSSAKDAVYKFTLAGTKTVSIDTAGSGFDTVLSLYKTSFATGDTPIDITGNQTNETGASAYNIGTVNGKRYVVTGGNTNGMAANYTQLQVDGPSPSCSSTKSGNSTSPDAIFKFHLDTSTTVRIDTNSSDSSFFDTMISLHNGPLPDLTIASLTTNGNNNSNEQVSSAYTVNSGSQLQNARFDGTTGAMAANVPVNNGLGCTSSGSAPDAVYKLNVATAGNYEINTVGSGFDTVLGLYPSTVTNATAPTITDKTNSGDKKSSAVAVTSGNFDGKWLSFKGDTSLSGIAADSGSTFTNCNALSSSKDVYYSFTLGSTRTVVIDTLGSSYDTVIGLYKVGSSSDTQQGCDDNSASALGDIVTKSLTSGTYYVIIKAASTASPTTGAYQINFRDTTVSSTNLQACDNNSGGGTDSKITTSLSVGTYYVVVKGRTSSSKGTYSLAIKALDLMDSANRVTCDDNGYSPYSKIESTLAAGDYWVVVKGRKTGSAYQGNYNLTVQDITTPPTSNYVTCNDDASSSVNTSSISQSLTAGTYYAIVKGNSSTDAGSYRLNIRDTAVSLINNLDCNYNSGAGGKPYIEKDLGVGTYRVIVKGKNSTDKGAYKLILRDLTQLPTKRLACDRNSGNGGKAYLESTLGSGTYTVVLSSDSSSSAGAYSLSLRDVNNVATMDNAISCNNDVSSSDSTSSLSTSLAAGTYYAAVKGYTTADVGSYQLNIGAGTTSSATYTPPTWTQTLAALTAKQVRVIPIISCHDDSSHGDSYSGLPGDCVTTRSQGNELAKATNTLGSNLTPLVFDIDSNGTGLSKTVVDGVAALAHYLEMNVQARVVFNPDANPGFSVVVRAVDSATDGCSGLVGIEHQHCIPGASPRFEIAFTNPTGAPVPLNPSDPNGGYNFRAELIGDNQFIVDQVPIYIIPRDVNPVPIPVPMVAASGNYWQDVAAPGCTSNQRPDWHDLTWSADVPLGTSVSFNLCASDKDTDLQTCPLTNLATITGGGPCNMDSQCTNGYCSTAGNCHTITAGSCTTDAQCFSGAQCRASKCTFGGQPIYVGNTLGANNFMTNLRMNVGLTGNTTTNKTPTVHDWSVTYLCTSVL